MEMEFFNVHESAHLAVKFLVLHRPENVGLEIRVRESPALDLGDQDDHYEAHWNLDFSNF
jgi:hypothetical protein